ncbi:hypothetical protein DH2020_017305 [Rehmannia glutinosa]|uniref:Protein kinase domain-containing protein n=1 Tax=Rehmannia glutinosa TaxID=99300 RepID=A0ABR0WRE3_REHGL
MSILSCCRVPRSDTMRKTTLKSKSYVQEIKGTKKYDDAEALSTIARSISMNTGASKQRMIAEDIIRHGNVRVPAEVVAVKQLDRNGVQGNREFLAESTCDTANPPIIYRDFKASNILLDETFDPKLSDFGLAKLGPTGGEDHVSTRVMGTYGYCAPEYAQTGQLSTKSDVYSFGVVFLEIISGRRAIDNKRPPEEENLVDWAKPLFRDRRKFKMMADPLLEGNYPVKGLYQALAVAAMCLQEEASTRPLIGDVVTALEFLAIRTDEVNSETDV